MVGVFSNKTDSGSNISCKATATSQCWQWFTKSNSS